MKGGKHSLSLTAWQLSAFHLCQSVNLYLHILELLDCYLALITPPECMVLLFYTQWLLQLGLCFNFLKEITDSFLNYAFKQRKVFPNVFVCQLIFFKPIQHVAKILWSIQFVFPVLQFLLSATIALSNIFVISIIPLQRFWWGGGIGKSIFS